MKKSLKGILLVSDGMEMQAQGHASSTAGRLVGRDHSIYSIPVTHAKLVGKLSTRFSSVQRRTRQTRKAVKTCSTIYCRKCYVGICVGQCFELNYTKMNYWK
jgi:hypothetical protein